MVAGCRALRPAALAAFDSKDYVNRLGLAARAQTPADIDQVMAPLGWRRSAWFGVPQAPRMPAGTDNFPEGRERRILPVLDDGISAPRLG